MRVTSVILLHILIYLVSDQLLFAHPVSNHLTDNEQSQQARTEMQAGNYAIAYSLWKPLAERGHSPAQFNIGWMYHNGYGLKIDDKIALSWWLKAAENGSPNAYFSLGNLYANGDGVTKNISIALGWYISAAQKNHAHARETLLALLERDDKKLYRETFIRLLKTDWSMLGTPMQVIVATANTRRGPDKSYQVVTTLNKGHSVIPLKEKNGWVYIGITGSGETAWIFHTLISKPTGAYTVN